MYDKRALHTGTIRSLDYWLGVPLCSLLTLVRAILPERTARPERILFLKFIEQGATVLAQEAIARAAARVGRDRIFFCVFESNRAILDVLGIVPPANVITIRDGRLDTFVVDFLRALAAVRSRRIDTVIDMEFFSRASAVFTFLTGARTRVGLHRFTGELPFRGNLMTHRVQYNPHLHIASLYSLLVDAAFLDPVDEPLGKFPLAIAADSGADPTPKYRFAPTPAELEKVRGQLGSGAPIIIVNPNASDLLPLRKWETPRFVELSRRILDRYPAAKIAVTGAPSEQTAAEAMCREVNLGERINDIEGTRLHAQPGHWGRSEGTARMTTPSYSPRDRVVSFAGKTSLRELLTLYSIADVLVTNDSGPGHFASLTPVHAVVLFGPETPRLFGSLAPATTIIWKELACSPCVSVFNHRLSPCQNNVCMQAITVDEVFDAVEGGLAERRKSSTPR